MTGLPQHLTGQQAHVVGAGIEGLSLARWFARQGASVTVHLARTLAEIGADPALARQAAEIEGLGASLRAGADYLGGLEGATVIGHVQSAYTYKYPMNVAALDAARARGVPTVTNISLFLALCPCPVIGITGTNGKTTTTEMTDAVLRAGGLPVQTGGNIGASPLDWVETLQPSDLVLLELSNYQLQFVQASPHVGAITNLAPDHLVDYGGSFERYTAAKRRILDFQRADDWAVLNWDDPLLRQWGAQAQAGLFAFNLTHALEPGAYLKRGVLTTRYQGQEKAVLRADALQVPGQHNVANALCAIAIGTLQGVEPEAMAQALQGYAAGPHRVQTVREQDGVRWVNDSKSTTPASTVAAIQAFPGRRLILLAGGKDKGLPVEDLVRAVQKSVAQVIAFGEWGPALAEAVEPTGVPVQTVRGVAEAVAMAVRLAQPGDVVLFSPAGTSFDAYASYAARGEHFVQCVGAL